MKKIYYLLMLVGILTIGFTSCEKEDLTPPTQPVNMVDTTNSTITPIDYENCIDTGMMVCCHDVINDNFVNEWTLANGYTAHLNFTSVYFAGDNFSMEYVDGTITYSDGTTDYFSNITGYSYKGSTWTHFMDTIKFPSDLVFLDKINGATYVGNGYLRFTIEYEIIITDSNNVQTDIWGFKDEFSIGDGQNIPQKMCYEILIDGDLIEDLYGLFNCINNKPSYNTNSAQWTRGVISFS